MLMVSKIPSFLVVPSFLSSDLCIKYSKEGTLKNIFLFKNAVTKNKQTFFIPRFGFTADGRVQVLQDNQRRWTGARRPLCSHQRRTTSSYVWLLLSVRYKTTLKGVTGGCVCSWEFSLPVVFSYDSHLSPAYSYVLSVLG